MLHLATTATANNSLQMKEVDQMSLDPKSIVESDSKSKSDHDSAFVDAFDYKAEDNSKMSKSSGSILNNISWVTETLSLVDGRLQKNKTNQKSSKQGHFVWKD